MNSRMCTHNAGCVCEEIRCSTKCGFNPKEANARSEQIANGGLMARKDGIRRLVLKKGAGNAQSDK